MKICLSFFSKFTLLTSSNLFILPHINTKFKILFLYSFTVNSVIQYFYLYNYIKHYAGFNECHIKFHCSMETPIYISCVNEFNYLGILFNRTGNFNKTIKKQAEKATKAMFEVLKRGRRHNLSIECQLELFNKMVKPILLYGSEIWGFSKNIQCLENVQFRFCKLLLKLKTSTPSYMIYGELGLFPIEIDVKLRMISYWARLLTGKETKLSYLSYKILYNLFIDEDLDFSWIKHVKHIFDDTGYSYIWSQQLFQNSDLLLALIRNRLHEQFTQEWHSLIQNSIIDYLKTTLNSKIISIFWKTKIYIHYANFEPQTTNYR